jgi:ABC-type phosphate transport system auxiliary subunit
LSTDKGKQWFLNNYNKELVNSLIKLYNCYYSSSPNTNLNGDKLNIIICIFKNIQIVNELSTPLNDVVSTQMSIINKILNNLETNK